MIVNKIVRIVSMVCVVAGLSSLSAMQRQVKVDTSRKGDWTVFVEPHRRLCSALQRMPREVSNVIPFIEAFRALLGATTDLIQAVYRYNGELTVAFYNCADCSVVAFDRDTETVELPNKVKPFKDKLLEMMRNIEAVITSQGSIKVDQSIFTQLKEMGTSQHSLLLSVCKGMHPEETIILFDRLRKSEQGYYHKCLHYLLQYPWLAKSWCWAKAHPWLSSPIGLLIFAHIFGAAQSAVCSAC